MMHNPKHIEIARYSINFCDLRLDLKLGKGGLKL